MKIVQLSELGALADDVRNGETIEIVDGDKPVATIRPYQAALKAHLDRMVAEGKATRGTGQLPPDFLSRPLIKAKKSVLEALLEDRHFDR